MISLRHVIYVELCSFHLSLLFVHEKNGCLENNRYVGDHICSTLALSSRVLEYEPESTAFLGTLWAPKAHSAHREKLLTNHQW